MKLLIVFDDLTLVELIVECGEKAVEALPAGIARRRGGREPEVGRRREYLEIAVDPYPNPMCKEAGHEVA